MKWKPRRLGLVFLMLLAASPAAHSDLGGWSPPVNLGPNINTTANDEGAAISSEGLSLYFTSDRTGGAGGQDIWVAQREHEDDPWGAPVNLGPPVNGTSNDFAPTFSHDGLRMYFVSNRPGGLGGLDIWVSSRREEDDDFGWQAPVNLGAPINSTANDAGPGFLRLGGEELLFITTNRAGGSGGPDIWRSVRQADGSFGPPAPVTELNSSGQDARASLRRDGREIFFFSDRAGSATTDLWTSIRADAQDPWSAPVNLGSIVNSPAGDNQPALSRNARTLFFSSNRPGGSGMLDLYMITRREADCESTAIIFQAREEQTAFSGQGVGINIPIVGRLIGGGNTLFLTALDVSNHADRDLVVDFYLDGEDLATGMPIAVRGSIGADGLPANRGAGGSLRRRSNAHFADFVDSLVISKLLPASIRTNGFLGSALFVFNGTNRRGQGGVTARFYSASGGGTIGSSLRGKEITTNEPQSLVATVSDTRGNTSGAPAIYPNLFINNTGVRPDATGAAGSVSVEITAIASSTGQSIGVPIVINGLGPGRTASIGQVLNALQIRRESETTVLVFVRVVAGNAAIQGLISQVDNVTRDSALFEMSRADF